MDRYILLLCLVSVGKWYDEDVTVDMIPVKDELFQ